MKIMVINPNTSTAMTDHMRGELLVAWDKRFSHALVRGFMDTRDIDEACEYIETLRRLNKEFRNEFYRCKWHYHDDDDSKKAKLVAHMRKWLHGNEEILQSKRTEFVEDIQCFFDYASRVVSDGGFLKHMELTLMSLDDVE